MHGAKTDLQNQSPKHVEGDFVRLLCKYSCVCKVGFISLFLDRCLYESPKQNFTQIRTPDSRAFMEGRGTTLLSPSWECQPDMIPDNLIINT
jgi:hypothetical protein